VATKTAQNQMDLIQIQSSLFIHLKMSISLCLPEEVIWVGEALQQETEDIADGSDGGLRQRLIPQSQQQFGNQLELPQ